ncbi:MAG: hypothetical protein K1X67_26760 [Fimbriimonadaceae bacterium]|nr:hypothetical protein [Fimbriimonadaceae bacterium]
MRALTVTLLLCYGLVMAGEPSDRPRLPYEDWGACPFECCTYREWIAKAPIIAFEDRNEKSALAFRLNESERVFAITGVVVTSKAGVTEILKAIQIGYVPESRGPVLSLNPGDVIYTLHYAGEGTEVFWYKGRTYVDQVWVPDNARGGELNSGAFKVRSRSVSVWWALIRNRAGQLGWTRETDRFSNQDRCG